MTNNVDGITELTGKLAAIESELNDMTADALSDGIAKVTRGIQHKAPVGATRDTRKAIRGSVNRRQQRHGLTSAKAGVNVAQRVRRGDGSGNRTPHAHFQIGTNPRFTKGGASRGSMPPNDFVGRGWSATVGPAEHSILTLMKRRIEAFG